MILHEAEHSKSPSPQRVENILEEWTASAVSPELRRQEFIRLLAQIVAVIRGAGAMMQLA